MRSMAKSNNYSRNNCSCKTLMASAISRGLFDLFNAMKICKIQDHIKFISECKRRKLVPFGLRTKDKLENTFKCKQSEELSRRQRFQWMTLLRKRFYSELHHLLNSKSLPFPLNQEDHKDFMKYKEASSLNKQNKLRKLLLEESNLKPDCEIINLDESSSTTVLPFENLTEYAFTDQQIELLNKGPSYIPASTGVSDLSNIAMIEASIYSLKCQLHRLDNKTEETSNSSSIYSSKWKYTQAFRRKIPSYDSPIIEIDKNIEELKIKLLSAYKENKNKNKQSKENLIIKEIKNLKSIMITPTDKTNKLVALSEQTYKDFFLEHLSNYETIENKRLPITEQNKFNKQLGEIANKYKEPIKSLLLTVKCFEPVPSSMYCVPKDHKATLKGRPIVNASDTPSTALCKLMADILNSLLTFIPAHLKNSHEFVERIKNYDWKDNDRFGSLDVTNLYGSIPIDGPENVIDIVCDFFERHKEHTDIQEITTNDFRCLINLCLFSDSIFIGDKLFKQKGGLAMGNNLSPCLAIIFMNFIENQIILKSNKKIHLWFRYIDDIFFVTNTPLENILEIANSVNDNIKFTLEKSTDFQIPFLDTLIRKQPGETVTTQLYMKPFHSGHILPWSSNTTIRQKIGIIKGERIRAERLSSNEEMKLASLKLIKDKFLKNGYPNKIISKHLFSNSKFNKNKPKTNTVIKLPFVNEKCSQIMQNLIKKSKLKHNPRIIFKTQAPLGILLQKPRQNFCGPKCICDGKNSCNKKNVTYKITCTICKETYIGETCRTIRTRIKEHLKQKESEVLKHFQNIHKILPELHNISWKTLGTGYISALHRKKHEEILIKNENPKINVIYNS